MFDLAVTLTFVWINSKMELVHLLCWVTIPYKSYNHLPKHSFLKYHANKNLGQTCSPTPRSDLIFNCQIFGCFSRTLFGFSQHSDSFAWKYEIIVNTQHDSCLKTRRHGKINMPSHDNTVQYQTQIFAKCALVSMFHHRCYDTSWQLL